jgi:hypothetical protein
MSLKVVISGSFRKHLRDFQVVMNKFRSQNVDVLAPASAEAINPEAEFVVLSSDSVALSNYKLEINYLKQIGRSNFHYIYNPNGYVGKSAAAEMAFAGLKGIPVIVAEEIKTFSGDIPIETQKILRIIGQDVVGVEDISLARLQDCLTEKLACQRGQLSSRYISKDNRAFLSALIKELILELRTS